MSFSFPSLPESSEFSYRDHLPSSRLILSWKGQDVSLLYSKNSEPDSVSLKLQGEKTVHIRREMIENNPETKKIVGYISFLQEVDQLHSSSNSEYCKIFFRELKYSICPPTNSLNSSMIFWSANFATLNRSNVLPLDTLPNSISDLLNLTRLCLFHTTLSSVPENIGQLTELRDLSLSRSQLSSLPESLGQLTKLQELNLSKNRLTEVPETLGQLIKLQSLFLSENQLSKVPESLGQLTNLQALNLSKNRLTEVPETLGQLTELQKLDLSKNQLTEVPETLGQLTELQRLSLFENQLSKVPESLGQLTELRTLNLVENRLTEVPETLGQLTELRELYLDNNYLSSVPESLGQLASLEELMLSHNQLYNLPESIGRLTSLELLFLDGNRLTLLPESLGQLASLEELMLSHNQLYNLPESIDQLQNLIFFETQFNPLRSLPSSLVGLPARLNISLTNHNLAERTLRGFQELLQQRQSSGLPTPRFTFSIPPLRDSSNPWPFQKSVERLKQFADKDSFDSSPFMDNMEPLTTWLYNLLQTSDFTTGSELTQSQLATVVLETIEHARQTPEFREPLNLFLDTANTSCVDRVTLSLIELETWIQLKKRRAQQTQDLAQEVSYLKSIWATKLLHDIADEKVQDLPLSDELDVHLAFLIHCKKTLSKRNIQLPFSSEKMRFFDITGVQPQELDAASQRVIDQFEGEAANRDFIEFLFQTGHPLSEESLSLFRQLFTQEIQQIQKEKEARHEQIESKAESASDQEIQEAYEQLCLWEKQQYVRLLDKLQPSTKKTFE